MIKDNVREIIVWRAAPSKAKTPLCTLELWTLHNGERDGWWFRDGRRKNGRHMSDESASDLLARHTERGNRIEEVG